MTPSAHVSVTWLPTHESEGWISMNRYHIELAAAAEARADLTVHCSAPRAKLVTERRGPLARSFYRYIVQPARARAARDSVAHVLDHSCAYLIPSLRGRRVVVTVHDLIPLLKENLLTEAQRRRFERNISNLVQADHLVCNSSWTRGTVIKRLGIPDTRVSVALLGVDPGFGLPANGSLRLQALSRGRYILSVGHTNPRKNLAVLPEVLREIARAGCDTCLVRAGDTMSESLAAQCRSALGMDRVIELGFVSDDELRWLYQNAGVFFMPSTFEGYGLPVAEAMAAGCPVVCSDVCSLPDVGGDAPLYFAPEDARSAARHLISAIEEPATREAMIKRGSARASSLSWSRHLDDLVTIYRGLS